MTALFFFLFVGVAGMMNWSVAIAPDVLKSRLQTGISELFGLFVFLDITLKLMLIEFSSHLLIQ